MQICARFHIAALTVFNEGLYQKAEVVRFGAEVADMPPGVARLADLHVHFWTGIAMKTVTFHLGGAQI